MNGRPGGPRYIDRAEEAEINAVLRQVRSDGRSRAVLLRGPGGIGKTSIVRQMAADSSDASTDWVRPIDADDPEVWLLSNLERRIVRQIDPGGGTSARTSSTCLACSPTLRGVPATRR